MSLAQALSAYINLNLLVAVGFGGLFVLTLGLRRLNLHLSSKRELDLNYFLLSMIFALTCVHPLLPKSEVFQPAAKVWSAPSMRDFAQNYTRADRGGYLSIASLNAAPVEAEKVSLIWILVTISLLAAGGVMIAGDLRRLWRIRRNSYRVRRIGRVTIFVNDEIKVPFSYWWFNAANVILPTALLNRQKDYHMALVHELQHHRHGDTKWVYVMWFIRLLCVGNPFSHLWNQKLSELQEFACDETLVDHKKVESQAYARCLVEVAKTAFEQEYIPACATGLLFLVERNILKRRIEKMMTKSTLKLGQKVSLSFGVVLALMLAITAYASSGLVQDRRVSLAQAEQWAVKAKSSTGFPVMVNDLVLTELNRYIGTPEGREFMRNALARMENYRSGITGKLAAYNAPVELLAVPLIESGYRNLTGGQTSPTIKGAGLWQFIPSTARNYGLHVSAVRDERLDVDLETDAAMRYLQGNHLRFKDWALSVLAYNAGEETVQRGISETGSRDAWTLIRKGYEGDKAYLAKVVAAVLIMKNPESVE